MVEAISTPRLDLSKEELSLVGRFFDLVDRTLTTHFTRTPFPYEIFVYYVNHLENRDEGFRKSVREQLKIFGEDFNANNKNRWASEEEAIIAKGKYLSDKIQELKTLYLEYQSKSSGLTECFWLNKLLKRKYGSGEKVFSPEEQEAFKREIFSFTDDKLIRRNLTPEGGGTGRTPSATFAEAALTHFGRREASNKRCRVLGKVVDVTYISTQARSVLESYNDYLQRKEKKTSERMDTPAAIEQEFIGLESKLKAPSHSATLAPSSATSLPSPPSTSACPSKPQVPRLDFATVDPSLPPIFSPGTAASITELGETFKRMLKTLAIASQDLLRTLQDEQKTLTAKVIKALPEELPLLPADPERTAVKTQELFSEVLNESFPLSAIEHLSSRVDMATESLANDLPWKLFPPNVLKEMQTADREAALNNHAYSIKYLFRNYELLILVQRALTCIKSMGQEN